MSAWSVMSPDVLATRHPSDSLNDFESLRSLRDA
jgi:hypothetical protein